MRLHPPKFWWLPEASAWARLLKPLADVYAAQARKPLLKTPPRINTPVICVGNLVVGGAGKTPIVSMLTSYLQAHGEKPYIISRGYGGKCKTPTLVQRRQHSAADVGDEPWMLAQKFPVIVSKDRLAACALAQELGATVCVLDDGFQSNRIHADCIILVVDAELGFGNGLCLPAGPLRAPLELQLQKADVIVALGDIFNPQLQQALQNLTIPVFRGEFVVAGKAANRLRGRNILAFAGIGRPGKFFKTLENIGAKVQRTYAFADHQALSSRQIKKLMQIAQKNRWQLVTTAKDYARLGNSSLEKAFKNKLTALHIEPDIKHGAALQALVLETVRNRRLTSSA